MPEIAQRIRLTSRSAPGASRRGRLVRFWANRLAPVRWTFGFAFGIAALAGCPGSSQVHRKKNGIKRDRKREVHDGTKNVCRPGGRAASLLRINRGEQRLSLDSVLP